jgi:hypothetical protein
MAIRALCSVRELYDNKNLVVANKNFAVWL